jgi:hypothetical protein
MDSSWTGPPRNPLNNQVLVWRKRRFLCERSGRNNGKNDDTEESSHGYLLD